MVIGSFHAVGSGAGSIAYSGWNPGTPGNMLAWFDATIGVTTSGSNVTAWADQSGNGHNLTGANNPTFSSTGWNSSQPAISFTSAAYCINTDSGFGHYVTGTNVVYCIFATVNLTNSNYSTICEWSDNAITSICSQRTITGTGGAQIDKFALGETHGSNNIRGSNKRICILSKADGTVYYYVDGNTEINGVSLSGALSVERILIGNNWNVANPCGTIAELIFYTADVSGQFSSYRTYSANKFGG